MLRQPRDTARALYVRKLARTLRTAVLAHGARKLRETRCGHRALVWPIPAVRLQLIGGELRRPVRMAQDRLPLGSRFGEPAIVPAVPETGAILRGVDHAVLKEGRDPTSKPLP